MTAVNIRSKKIHHRPGSPSEVAVGVCVLAKLCPRIHSCWWQEGRNKGTRSYLSGSYRGVTNLRGSSWRKLVLILPVVPVKGQYQSAVNHSKLNILLKLLPHGNSENKAAEKNPDEGRVESW